VARQLVQEPWRLPVSLLVNDINTSTCFDPGTPHYLLQYSLASNLWPLAILLCTFHSPIMLWSALVFAATAQAQFSPGLNHLRFGCSQITIERLDPLVNPGMAPTPHMHQVVGGNAFNASVPETDVSKLASCTTCGPADDLSNYWTANLYFKARNGTYKRVPQVPNRYVWEVFSSIKITRGRLLHSTRRLSMKSLLIHFHQKSRFLFNDKFTTQTSGGVTVYYISPKKGEVTAFKPASSFDI
jgi:hypothetical protein